MTTVGTVLITGFAAMGAAFTMHASRGWAGSMNDGRPEHRIDPTAGERAAESARMQRHIATSTAMDPGDREPGDRAMTVSAAMTPSSGTVAARGPFQTVQRELPVARGGGPQARVQSITNDELGTARGIRFEGPGVVSAPLGCSRIQAVGTPRVQQIDLAVHDADGSRVAHVMRNGRFAMLPFCARDAGRYTISARSIGRNTVSDPVQVFVE